MSADHDKQSIESYGTLPEGEDLKQNVQGRQSIGKLWEYVLLASTIIGLLVLATLLYRIVDQAVGVVAVQNQIEPSELMVNGNPIGERPIEDLSQEELTAILEAQAEGSGTLRRLNREEPFAERSQTDLIQVLEGEVLQPEVVQSWHMSEGLFDKELPTGIKAYIEPLTEDMIAGASQAELIEILRAPAHTNESIQEKDRERSFEQRPEAELRELVQIEVINTGPKYPQAELEWRSWVAWDFLTSPMDSTPALAGVRTALLGSLWVMIITFLTAFPLGVGAAIYLEEYASETRNNTLRRINSVIQTNINNLAGVPSIIYGMLGLAIFVRALEGLTSGALFGVAADADTANGRTIISAGLTLALLILPIIIINAQEAIRAVPRSLRQASFGLGATRWQTVWNHVLPNALPGIMTGTILGMSRAVGETAPLIVVGASTFIVTDPEGPFAKFTALPILIYNWTARPDDQFRNAAAAGIIVLLVVLLSMNAAAVMLRNRFQRRV